MLELAALASSVVRRVCRPNPLGFTRECRSDGHLRARALSKTQAFVYTSHSLTPSSSSSSPDPPSSTSRPLPRRRLASGASCLPFRGRPLPLRLS